MHECLPPSDPSGLTRRELITGIGGVVAGACMATCGFHQSDETNREERVTPDEAAVMIEDEIERASHTLHDRITRQMLSTVNYEMAALHYALIEIHTDFEHDKSAHIPYERLKGDRDMWNAFQKYRLCLAPLRGRQAYRDSIHTWIHESQRISHLAGELVKTIDQVHSHEHWKSNEDTPNVRNNRT